MLNYQRVLYISLYPRALGMMPCVISNHLYNCSRFSCFWAWFFNEQSRWENAQPPTNIRTAEVEPQAIWAMLVPSSSNNFGKIRENSWIIGTWWEIKWKIMGKTPIHCHIIIYPPKKGWLVDSKSESRTNWLQQAATTSNHGIAGTLFTHAQLFRPRISRMGCNINKNEVSYWT